MGKLNEGILGGFSGIVGPVVGARWRNVNVIRSRPPRKRRRSSEDQKKQMAKMALMSPFVRPLRNLLNSTYHQENIQKSCFNKALSYNMRNAISGDYPAFAIDYARVVMGVGDLLNVEHPQISSDETGKLTFSWRDNSNEGSARTTDQFFAAVYCEELKRWVTVKNGNPRNAGSYKLDVAAFNGKAVQTYIGFLSADARFVTTSLYTGTLIIL
jgi:Family of unknown function (DUF6266)